MLSALIAAGATAGYLASHRAPPKQNIVSGRAGLKHTKSGEVERWWRARVTVTLDGSLAALSPSAEDAVQEAFGAWVSSEAKIPRLAFDAKNKKNLVLSPDGENRIYYAPIRVPGHEGDLAITLGYTNDATGEIVEADVIVNSLRPFALLDASTGTETSDSAKSGAHSAADDSSTDKGGSSGKHTTAEDSSTDKAGSSSKHGSSTPGHEVTPPPSCTQTYDLRSVVTHEAGHFFGLGEDMTDTVATMYYSTRPCDVHKRELKTDDAEQVSSLYAATPNGAPSEDEPASAQNCSVGSLGHRAGGVPSSGLLAALALSAIRARRRRP